MAAFSNTSSFPDIIDFGNASKMVSLTQKEIASFLANRLIDIKWVVTRASSETNPT